MTDKKSFDIHAFSLFFCFTLGGCFFLFGKCGIINMLWAFLLGGVTLPALLLLCRARFCRTRAFSFAAGAFCLAVFGFTFIKFIDFTLDRALLHTPRFAAVALFAAVICFFVRAKDTALKKFCLLSCAAGAVFIAVILLAAADNFEFSNMECLPDFDIKEVARNYLIIFLPALIPAATQKQRFASASAGYCAAGAVFLTFSLFTVCNFGRVNDLLDYPALALSDTVNVGRIFTRLGSLLHAVIFRDLSYTLRYMS